MVNESFCSACQAMLASEILHNDGEFFPHHLDRDSFQQALRSGCRICLQTWADAGSPDVVDSTEWRVNLAFSHILITFHSTLMNYNGYGYGYGFGSLYFKPFSGQEITLSDNTCSDQAFAFLMSKYEQCKREHTRCSRIASGQYKPTRLLDVGGTQSSSVRLVDKEHLQIDSSYASLSHCWGQSMPFKLTATTVSALRSGILVSQLPKTFQDAITTTRRMKIPYLWIDSLCIVQDDLSDWSAQAIIMQEIYHGATLNIAATAAEDGNVGLFYHRNPKWFEPFKVDAAWSATPATDITVNTAYHSIRCFRWRSTQRLIDDAPLNKRAWVMQERHLSRRIVHFTSEQLFWECHETFASETHLSKIPMEPVDHPVWNTRGLKLLLASQDPSVEHRDRLYTAWYTFRYHYNQCQLKYEDDRFAAFAGIAQTLSNALQDELVAGLWRSRLIYDLCWHKLGGARRTQPWIAPSWSWAAFNDFIYKSSLASGEMKDVAEVVNVDVRAKRSGALTNGCLKLRCRPVPAFLELKKLKDDSKSLWWVDLGDSPSSLQGVNYGWKIHFDLDDAQFTHSNEGRISISILILQVHSITEDFDPLLQQARGIIVVPAVQRKDAFERIGSFEYSYDQDDNQDDDQDDRPHPFWIELVQKYREATEQVIEII